eukprot:s2287_g2.t3
MDDLRQEGNKRALVPESPPRALDAQLSQEEVALFSEEAARNQLKAIEARRRPPDLHEVVSVLSLLPFTGSNRRKLERQLLNFAQMDKQASNPVFLLANTIVAGFAKKTEDGKIRAFDFFLADLKVMQQLWTFWKDTKGRLRNFYSIPPCSVFYLLERVVVWASVLLTQFNNTLLPQSYLHAHITGAEELLQEVASAGAKVAAEWRPTALNALKHVVEFVVAFLYWDHSLYEWLDKTKASYGESVLRLYVLVLAASANDEEAPGCGMWGAALQKTTYGAGRYWGDAGILEQTTDSEDEDQEGLEDESISAYLMEGYLEEGRRRLGQHLTDTQLLDEAALSRCPPPSPTSEASQKRHFRPAALGGFANTADKVSLRLNKDLAAKWTAKEVLQMTGKHLGQFDPVNAIMALHRVGRSMDRGEVQSEASLRVTLNALVDKVTSIVHEEGSQLEAKELAKTCWALAKLSMNSAPVMDQLWGEVVTDQLSQRAAELDGHGLSNAVWGFATIRLGDQRLVQAVAGEALLRVSELSYHSPQLFSLFAERALHSVADFDPQGLANMTWAFATLAFQHAKFTDVIAREMLLGISRWSSQHIGNTTWSFAKLRVYAPRVYSAISTEVLHTLPSWNAQGLSNVVWAFAKLEIHHRPFFGALAVDIAAKAYAKVHQEEADLFAAAAASVCLQAATFNPQHCSNTLWAFACLSLYAEPALQAARKKAGTFQPQNLSISAFSLAQLRVSDRSTLSLGEARKFAFEHWNTKLKLDKKLDIFRKVREKEKTDLPTAMQRLMCFDTRGGPWLTWVMAWQNDILAKLGDPYVRLFRQSTKHTRLTRTLDRYEPFQMPRLRANDTEKVKKRDGQSCLLQPLPYIGFHKMRKFRVVTKEGTYKDISSSFSVKAAQAETRAQEPEDAEEEAEGAGEELSTPAVTAPDAEEAVPEADTTEGEPAKAESKAETELSNILAATTAPRLDDDMKFEAAKERREKSLFERAFKAWRSWKEEKEKSKRAREEQRRKRRELVKQGEEDEVEDRDTLETEELRLRFTAAELCAQLLGGEARGTPKVLLEELEKWFEHCLRMMGEHRRRWKKKVRETFEEQSESLNERFDALLGELAGEDDLTICSEELGHDVMKSLGEASMCQLDTLTCQLRARAAIGLSELLAEACRDEGTEVKPVIQLLRSVLATTTFELPAERKRLVLSDADQAAPDVNPPSAAPAQEPSLAEDDEEKPEDQLEEAPVPATEEEEHLAPAQPKEATVKESEDPQEEKPSPTTAVVEVEEEIERLPAHEKEKDPLMGVAIDKKINGEVYRGKVEDIEVGKVSRDRLYRIRYQDNDLEHMEEPEVRALLVPHAASVAVLAGNDTDEAKASEPQAALRHEPEKERKESTEEAKVGDDSADDVETPSDRQQVQVPTVQEEEKIEAKEPSDQTMLAVEVEPEGGEDENGIFNMISSKATKMMEVFCGRPATPELDTEVPREEVEVKGVEETEAKEPLEKDSDNPPVPVERPSTPTGPSRTAPANPAASPSPEAKRKSKASKHAAKRQQKREEKEAPSASASVKDEPPEWYEEEQELRAKVLDLCKQALESAGNIKEAKQVLQKKKGPGWHLEQLIQKLRTWCDHCEKRQERDCARWNRQIRKAYDYESDQISYLGEALADEPRSSTEKDWPVTDLLDRAKKPQRFTSVLLRSHLDVETVGVFVEVLRAWQLQSDIVANAPKEVFSLLTAEQAEKLGRRARVESDTRGTIHTSSMLAPHLAWKGST